MGLNIQLIVNYLHQSYYLFYLDRCAWWSSDKTFKMYRWMSARHQRWRSSWPSTPPPNTDLFLFFQPLCSFKWNECVCRSCFYAPALHSITSGFNSACCGIQNKLLFKAIVASLFLSLYAVAQRPIIMNSETLSKVEPPLFIEPNSEWRIWNNNGFLPQSNQSCNSNKK